LNQQSLPYCAEGHSLDNNQPFLGYAVPRFLLDYPVFWGATSVATVSLRGIVHQQSWLSAPKEIAGVSPP
jgi:hypothetical protein